MKVRLMGAVVATALLAGLSGCSDPQPSATPGPTVTATATSTVTPAPTSAAESPDDPLGPLSAWNACALLAQEQYVNRYPGSEVIAYDEAHAPTTNPDGSFTAIVSIKPPAGVSGGIVAICDLSGTVGTPTLVQFTLKDI